MQNVLLLTPLGECETRAEQRYNYAQIRTRNPVERLFGVWKRRFPWVSMGLRVDRQLTCEIIVATAILHNICLEERDGVNEVPEENIEEIGVVDYARNHPNQNTATRDTLINTVFSM